MYLHTQALYKIKPGKRERQDYCLLCECECLDMYIFPRPCPFQTGTLTQNIMTFLKCSIRGVKYGEVTLEDVEREQVVSTGEFSDITDEQLTTAGAVCPSPSV